MQNLINEFTALLDSHASIDRKKWWEGYMKNVIPFRGVGIPVIRSQMKNFYNENQIGDWPVDKQFDLALQFFHGSHTEDKLSGTLLIELYLLDKLAYMKAIPQYKRLFTDELIFDWNVCDWFCVRVLGPTIKNSENACAKWISGWRGADNLWQSRASLVAFVNLADQTDYHTLIKKSAEVLIRQKERFRKTAVGWVMREIAHHNKLFVLDFLRSNLKFFTPETLRNVTKHFDKEEKKEWQKSFRKLQVKNKN